MKITDLQQKQLSNLLDTVPDKVLICSPVPEGGVAEGIYSNRKMNEFFGGNMGFKAGENSALYQTRRAKASAKRNPRVKQKILMGKQIFRNCMDDAITPSDLIGESKQSLNEIIKKHQLEKKESNVMGLRTGSRYKVLKPNKYASDQREMTIELQMFDVVYGQKLCNLVYIRDISDFIQETMIDPFQRRKRPIVPS